MICALGITAPSPCQRAPCDACREALEERAAIIQFCSGRPVTREEADELARQQARDALPGQRELLRTGA